MVLTLIGIGVLRFPFRYSRLLYLRCYNCYGSEHRYGTQTAITGLTSIDTVGPVIYAGRDHETETAGDQHIDGPPTRAAFLKPIEFKPQREYRLTFAPSSEPVEPMQ